MQINPNELPMRDVYKLLTGSIVPRPIAWVSSVNSDGQPNLAPFSFFTAVCSDPPTVLFCPGIRSTDGSQKDTFNNVQATGEYIINIVNEDTAEAMNITATELPAHVNEFERAGLTPEAGVKVNVPRVKESPISFECQLQQVVTINDGVGGGHIVIGTVVWMHYADGIWQENNYINTAALQPVGRLAGPNYSRTRDLFSLHRLPPEIDPKS